MDGKSLRRLSGVVRGRRVFGGYCMNLGDPDRRGWRPRPLSGGAGQEVGDARSSVDRRDNTTRRERRGITVANTFEGRSGLD